MFTSYGTWCMMGTMKANRRTVLLRSGMELISLHGYRDVSVADITGGCGLSVGTFYKYFTGKEAFYDQILQLIEQEGVRKAEDVVRRLHSPLNKLKALYRFAFLGVRRYPILRGVLQHDERFLYPGIDLKNGSVPVLRKRIEGMVRDIIREGSRRGVFRPGLYHDAHLLVMSMLDVVIFNLDNPRFDALAQDMLVLLERGLLRSLRLRRRDERRDRRILSDEELLDWFET